MSPLSCATRLGPPAILTNGIISNVHIFTTTGRRFPLIAADETTEDDVDNIIDVEALMSCVVNNDDYHVAGVNVEDHYENDKGVADVIITKM